MGGRRTRQRPRGRAASRAAPYAFADEIVILREHEPDRHGERIRGDVFASRCARAESRARNPLVLIVDDNEKNRKLAGDVLRAAGFRTLEAGTAAEGIAIATEHLPDVILMDLQLPDMDGTDAARSLADGTHGTDTGRCAQRPPARERRRSVLAAGSPPTFRSRSTSAHSRSRCATSAQDREDDRKRHDRPASTVATVACRL